MIKNIVNGQIQDTINVSDRGIAYGDGLFETIACVNGHLQFWHEHIKRLEKSCKRLALPVTAINVWQDDIRKLKITEKKCVIKLIITRGSGGRGYKMPKEPTVSRIVSKHDWPNYPEQLNKQGAKVIICKTPVSINSALAGLKHLNRLDNVLARAEWNDASILDGLMLDNNGYVIEGTMSNLFCVKDQQLYTPFIKDAGVEGIIRNKIIDLAKTQNISCQKKNISINDLLNMDEIFLSNSLFGICPVAQLNNSLFKQWPITNTLQQSLNTDENSVEL